MMVKFVMSKGNGFVLTGEQAKGVIEAPQQLVMIHGKDGLWTGKTINKAHIVSTDYDREASKEREREQRKALPEPVITPEERERMAEASAAIGERLKIKVHE